MTVQVENRTYLWISLISPELEKRAGLSEKKLLQAVQTIPTTIDGACESISSRSTNPKEARTLLQIVLGAERPLTLDEMNIALSMTDEYRCMKDLDIKITKLLSHNYTRPLWFIHWYRGLEDLPHTSDN